MSNNHNDKRNDDLRTVAKTIMALVLIFLGLYVVLDRTQQQATRAKLGFMAERGGVGATYLEVDALMKGAFRPGMMRDEVIDKLDRMFGCYKLYPLDWRTGEVADDWRYVLFPGTDCTCDEFQVQGSGCFATSYTFLFDRDMLVHVSRPSS